MRAKPLFEIAAHETLGELIDDGKFIQVGVLNGHAGQVGKRFEEDKIFGREDVACRSVIDVHRSDDVAVLFRDEGHAHDAADFEIHHALGFGQRVVFDDVPAEDGLTLVDDVVHDTAAVLHRILKRGGIDVGGGMRDAQISGDRMSQKDQRAFRLDFTSHHIHDFFQKLIQIGDADQRLSNFQECFVAVRFPSLSSRLFHDGSFASNSFNRSAYSRVQTRVFPPC